MLQLSAVAYYLRNPRRQSRVENPVVVRNAI